MKSLSLLFWFACLLLMASQDMNLIMQVMGVGR